MSTPIGDPRPAGDNGPAGDQRQAGESGTAGDPRPAGIESIKDAKRGKPKPSNAE